MMMMSGLRMNSTTSHAQPFTMRSNMATLLAEHAAMQRDHCHVHQEQDEHERGADGPVGRERELLIDHRADGRYAVATEERRRDERADGEAEHEKRPGADARQRKGERD